LEDSCRSDLLFEGDAYPVFVAPNDVGTQQADRFDLLALIVEDYERKSWPIEPPETIEAIRYRMETGGRSWASARLAAACFRHPGQEASPHDDNGLEAAPRVEDPGRSADRAASDAGKKVSRVIA
jgi:hypothetical protein